MHSASYTETLSLNAHSLAGSRWSHAYSSGQQQALDLLSDLSLTRPVPKQKLESGREVKPESALAVGYRKGDFARPIHSSLLRGLRAPSAWLTGDNVGRD